MTAPLVCMAEVTAGLAVVTVTEPTVLGPLNCRPGAAVALGGVAHFIVDRPSPSTFVIERPWSGATATVPCSIGAFTAEMASGLSISRQLTDYSAKLALLHSRGNGMFYTALGPTGPADPGPGKIGYVGASWEASTSICIDVLDAAGVDQTALIDQWGLGDIIIVGSIETDGYVAFELTEKPINEGPGAWRRLTQYAHVGGAGEVVATEAARIIWQRAGAPGPGYQVDAEVDDEAGLAAHANAAVGFKVFVRDAGGANAGRSAVKRRVGAAGNWTLVTYYTGPRGFGGWTMVFAAVADGARTVRKLVGYIGGEGAAPTAFVGWYEGPAGLVELVAGATDIRGPMGPGILSAGDYDNGGAYVPGMYVQHLGSSWVNTAASTGVPPPALPATSNAHWQLLSRKGFDGAGTVAGLVAGTGIAVDPTDPTLPIVSAVVASKAEAEAGVATDALMTPQRTAQAILALSPPTDLTPVEAAITRARRVSLLGLADTAKALTGYRRYLDTVAFGFKSAGEADASSANGAVDTAAGAWRPNLRVARAVPTVSAPIGGVSNLANINDNNPATTSTWVGQNLGGRPVASRIIWRLDLGAERSIKSIELKALRLALSAITQSAIHTSSDGTSWTQYGTEFALTTSSADYTRTADRTARYVGYAPGAADWSGGYDYVVGDFNVFVEEGGANAILVLPYQAAPATRTKARAILEIDPVDAITLGSDWAVELTCNGGTSWHPAGAYTNCGKGQNGRTIVETDLVTCTSGTSVSARIKNLNNKMVHVHKAVLEAFA